MRPADNIEKAIKQLQDHTTAEMDKRTLSDVYSAMDESIKSSSSSNEGAAWRNIMQSKTAKFAAAAIIIIAVIIGINHFGGSIDGASVAFAAVERNMQEAQSFSYTVSLKRPDKPEIIYHLYVKGSRYRKTDSGGGIQIAGQGKVVDLKPSEKRATIREHKSPDRPIDELLGFLDSWRMGKVEELGERLFDGRTAVGFRTDTKDGIERKQIIDVWVDVQTKYPVLIETNYPENGVNLKMGNFVWNAELDDSLFDLTIPEDYSINDRR